MLNQENFRYSLQRCSCCKMIAEGQKVPCVGSDWTNLHRKVNNDVDRMVCRMGLLLASQSQNRIASDERVPCWRHISLHPERERRIRGRVAASAEVKSRREDRLTNRNGSSHLDVRPHSALRCTSSCCSSPFCTLTTLSLAPSHPQHP